MAQAQDLRQMITSVAGRPGPVLSAYLSVNADIPENQRRAYLVRLRDAMNDEGVPEALQQPVREYVEDETPPGARRRCISPRWSKGPESAVVARAWFRSWSKGRDGYAFC